LIIAINLAFAFLTSFFTALYILPKLAGIATKIGLLDHPNSRKVHLTPKPLVGGIGIAIGLSISTLLVFPYLNLRGFYTGAILLVLIGFLDDFSEVNHRLKFVLQVFAALCIVFIGKTVLSSFGDLLAFGNITLGVLSIPLTIFCTVGVINAVNMIDGLDGLAGGVSLISLMAFSVLSYINNQIELVFLSVALIGAVIAFLKYNWHPARLFMGDAGSIFLGFSLAFLSIAITQKADGIVPPVAPLLILAVPITDTVTIMMKRLLNRKNPFKADRYHLHHILVRLGIEKRNSVKVILSAVTLFALIATIGTVLQIPEYILFSVFAVYFSAYFVLSFRIKDMVRFKVRVKRKRMKIERRASIRRTENLVFEFVTPAVTEGKGYVLQSGKGRTVDISEGGVGLITEYPFEEGQQIIVYKNGAKKTPYGMTVQWVRKINGHYRVGLVYSSHENEVLLQEMKKEAIV